MVIREPGGESGSDGVGGWIEGEARRRLDEKVTTAEETKSEILVENRKKQRRVVFQHYLSLFLRVCLLLTQIDRWLAAS